MQFKSERDLLLGLVVGLLTTAIVIKFGGMDVLRRLKTSLKKDRKAKNHGLTLIKKVQS